MADTAETTSHCKLNGTVVLVGMMGAGKTAVGRCIAQMLDVPFVDSDAAIEEAANMTVAEIFERFGEPFFRDKESQIINRLLDDAPCILSTGGGAFMRAENREAMARKGVSVWLDASVDLLWSRVRHKDTRPLLRAADPYGTLARLYDRRVPVYALAQLRVTGRPEYAIEDTANLVIQALKDHRPDILEDTP